MWRSDGQRNEDVGRAGTASLYMLSPRGRLNDIEVSIYWFGEGNLIWWGVDILRNLFRNDNRNEGEVS